MPKKKFVFAGKCTNCGLWSKISSEHNGGFHYLYWPDDDKCPFCKKKVESYFKNIEIEESQLASLNVRV